MIRKFFGLSNKDKEDDKGEDSQETKDGEGNLISVVAEPRREYELADASAIATTHVLFQVKSAGSKEQKARAPLDMCIVLDRSGSMSGSRLQNAKRAIRKIIKHLTPDDRLHLVQYDHKSQTVFENGDLNKKEKLVEQVKAIRTGGSTNISDAMRAGYNLLVKNAKRKRSRALFLFSDGQYNAGPMKDNEGHWKLAASFLEENVRVSSFGIGDDFNETLMRGIAEHGQGKYFFIDTAQNIPKYVSKAIHGLMDTVAVNGTLMVKGVNGAELIKLSKTNDITKGVFMPTIVGNDTQRILAQVQIPSKSEGKEPVEIIKYSFTFTEKNPEVTKTIKGVVSIRYTKTSSLLKKENSEVLVALAMQEAAVKDREVAALLSTGDLAAAKTKKEETMTLLRSVVEKDTKGHIKKMIEYGEQDLVSIQKKDTKKAKKSVEYHEYKGTQYSDDGFDSGNDSDEDAYSDQEESPPSGQFAYAGSGDDMSDSD